MKQSKKVLFLLFFFSSFFLISVGLTPFVRATDDTTYILSNDIIKNFKVDSFNGLPVGISGATLDGKMMFETQASWKITKDDLQLIQVYTQGDTAYIQYKMGATTKINMYTTVPIEKSAGAFNKINDNYQIAEYYHCNEFGGVLYGWEAFMDWKHYSFGDIKLYNSKNNFFKGPVVMSFDIAQSSLPDFQTISGDALVKNFDYIAVSSAGVVNNIIGKLNNTAPTIVGLTPRDYSTETYNSKVADPVPNGQIANIYYAWDPKISLTIHPDPLNSWDGKIIPQTVGSSLNPTNKDGTPIWDPSAKQQSMTDCKMAYQLQICPYITEYYGTLSFQYQEVVTWEKFFWQGPYIKFHNELDYTYTKPIALHCTNRYVQTEVKVVFDLFASYNIDVGANGIEDFVLSFPEEYYDLLLWLTAVEGFGGGIQYTATPDPADAFWDWISGIFSNIWSWIIMFLILAVVIVVFVYVVIPYLRNRSRKR